MDNTKPKKPLYMDIMSTKRQPSAAFLEAQAKLQAKSRPAAKPFTRVPAKSAPVAYSLDPFRPRPVVDTAVIEGREKRQNMSDFRPASAKPAQKPAAKPAPTTVKPAQPAEPKLVETTSVTEVAFGVIEETATIVKTEAPYEPGKLPAKDTPKDAKKPSLFKKSKPEERKSPFLTSVNVEKRPLSASMPTGSHTAGAPAIVHASGTPIPVTEPKKRKKSSTPFIVIVILSVLLGVSIGALVYFVLPH